MSILDAVADWQMGGPIPAIRAVFGSKHSGPTEEPGDCYRAYVDDHPVGLAATWFDGIMLADHARKHWCDIPHRCPNTVIIRADGEIGEDQDDYAPSVSTYQRQLDDERLQHE